MLLGHLCIFSEKMFTEVLCHFLTEMLVFLLFNYNFLLYFAYSTFIRHMIYKYFSHSFDCRFTFLTVRDLDPQSLWGLLIMGCPGMQLGLDDPFPSWPLHTQVQHFYVLWSLCLHRSGPLQGLLHAGWASLSMVISG